MKTANTMMTSLLSLPGAQALTTATGRILSGPLTEATADHFWMTPDDHRSQDVAVWGTSDHPVCHITEGNGGLSGGREGKVSVNFVTKPVMRQNGFMHVALNARPEFFQHLLSRRPISLTALSHVTRQLNWVNSLSELSKSIGLSSAEASAALIGSRIMVGMSCLYYAAVNLFKSPTALDGVLSLFLSLLGLGLLGFSRMERNAAKQLNKILSALSPTDFERVDYIFGHPQIFYDVIDKKIIPLLSSKRDEAKSHNHPGMEMRCSSAIEELRTFLAPKYLMKKDIGPQDVLKDLRTVRRILDDYGFQEMKL